MKKYLSFVLVLLMVLPLLLLSAPKASAESLYIRKIVSVVYDDSGSMDLYNMDKAAYANYAMQTFCGMLNSEDQLYITKMSTKTPQKIDLSAGGIQKSVDTIRKYNHNGGTPFEAVTNAVNHLASIEDSNPNTQYWLVVISDGVFNEIENYKIEEQKKYLNDKMSAFADLEMKNGSKMQINFLGIGNDLVVPDANPAKGIYAYEAKTAANITGEMAALADRISGRTRLTDTDMKLEGDRTVRVSSAVPLLNIAVLAQGSDAKVTKATVSGGADIPVSRRATVSYPNYESKGLAGGAYLLGDSQNPIVAGTYTITFDKPVELKNVVVLYEPALEVRGTILLNGQPVNDFKELNEASEGDKISLSYKLYEMGTDKEVSPTLLPGNTRYEAAIYENGSVVAQSSGTTMEIKDYVLKNTPTEIRVAVTIAGFNPISASVKFNPRKFVLYTVAAEHVGGSNSVKLEEISNHDVTICFRVYGNGTLITDPAQVQKLNPTITASPQGNAATMEITADGGILVKPKAAQAPAGCYDQYTVNVSCQLANGAFATESYTVVMPAYTVEAEFISSTQSVKLDEISANTELGIRFTVRKDGVALTDPEALKALNPTITLSPQGNDGTMDYTADGKIVFTPNTATAPAGCKDQFQVTVSCGLTNGASTSAEYTVLMPVYTLEAAFGNDNQSVKFDEISMNRDMTLVFTVLKDGVALTDPEAVKAFNPVCSVSPNGNNGTVTVSDDGKIIFTPNVAALPASHDGRFTVDVTCAIDGDVRVSKSYTVLVADYQIVPVENQESIVKTQFFGNTIGASFYITKDGVRMNKAALGQVSAQLDDRHSNLQFRLEVAEDGLITVTPYSETDCASNFWTKYIVHWWIYFGLENRDVTVTLQHSVGTADNVLQVRGETAMYQLLRVWLPLILEVALLLFLIWWVYAIIAKPKFLADSAIYMGKMYLEGSVGNQYHQIIGFETIRLERYNKLKYRWKPTLNSTVVSLGKGVSVAAGDGGAIVCHCKVWYKGDITPKTHTEEPLDHPKRVQRHIRNNGELNIKVLSPYTEQVQAVTTLNAPNRELYFVQTDLSKMVKGHHGQDQIQEGTLFAYARDNV